MIRGGHFDVLIPVDELDHYPSLHRFSERPMVKTQEGREFAVLKAQDNGHCGFACLLFLRRILKVEERTTNDTVLASEDEALIVGSDSPERSPDRGLQAPEPCSVRSVNY